MQASLPPPRTVEFDPAASLYGDPLSGGLVKVVAVLVVLGAVITVVVAVHAWRKKNRAAVATLAAVWAVLPPAWFWVDYFVLYKPYSVPGSFEYFRHGQQLSAGIWAGIALTLAALASSDRFRESTPIDR